ncbi:sigma factor-like helix-turn-helix DNA-binding protein [Pedobacter sp. JY14-1]|uniref:sigma factor-like helix-turn-helix DNA-binding protein n=1 Tax=Pedobacter sp. JY14-1 TaxID=3034151 RepID=UPI0023E3504B|nr:sigma factor-like helix-turn-helix DNA-binding protein [Pedobacter sp. JY14-1]
MLELEQERKKIRENPDLQAIYNRYSGMLLGYLTEIVKDNRKAEDHLVNIFSEISKLPPQQIQQLFNWNRLRRFTLLQLPPQNTILSGRGGVHAVLSNEQQYVFDSVYYSNLSLAEIAERIGQREETVRKILKEAFNLMKGKSEY